MPTNILLINPWIHDFAAVNMWIKPLGLLTVAEYLSSFNVNLSLIDCLDDYFSDRKFLYRYPKKPLPLPEVLTPFPRTFYQYGMDESSFQHKLKQAQPDLIIVTCIMTYWYTGAAKVIDYCKQTYPDVPVILGGLYARLFPEHARQHTGADVIYTGLADEKLLDVFSDLGMDLKPHQEQRAWYDLSFYDQLPYAPIITSLGCPFHCPYCASRELNPCFMQFPPQQILQDIDRLAGQGVQDFAFYDDALLYQAQDHLDVILAQLPPNNIYRFHTPNGLHARYINQQTARLMAQSNFQTIRLSLETIDTRRQSETGNKIDNRQFSEAVCCLQAAGFTKQQLGVYLMYGFPDQPPEELWDGVHFLQQLGVRIHFTELSPLPGTRTWQTLIDQTIITPDIDPLLTNNTVFASRFTTFSLENIRALREEASRINQQLN